MQVQSVVPATLASPSVTMAQAKPTVVNTPTPTPATMTNATSTASSHTAQSSGGEGMVCLFYITMRRSHSNETQYLEKLDVGNFSSAELSIFKINTVLLQDTNFRGLKISFQRLNPHVKAKDSKFSIHVHFINKSVF